MWTTKLFGSFLSFRPNVDQENRTLFCRIRGPRCNKRLLNTSHQLDEVVVWVILFSHRRGATGETVTVTRKIKNCYYVELCPPLVPRRTETTTQNHQNPHEKPGIHGFPVPCGFRDTLYKSSSPTLMRYTCRFVVIIFLQSGITIIRQ